MEFQSRLGEMKGIRRALGLLVLTLFSLVVIGSLVKTSGFSGSLMRNLPIHTESLGSVLDVQSDKELGFMQVTRSIFNTPPPCSTNGLTSKASYRIMTPTFKRPHLLPLFLANYAMGNIPSLQKIVLMWHDNTTEPPRELLESLPSYQVPVIMEYRPISLNERFHKSESITTECVLSIDDDMLFAPADIERGYQSWREFGGAQRMVGYISRDVVDRKYDMQNKESYSIILTKSAFFHTDWMDVYWAQNKQMTDLRTFVNERRNCEDILMSFVMARQTRMAPLLVTASFVDEGTTNGISTQPGHLNVRSTCVQHFLDIFGEDTLVSASWQLTAFEGE